MYVQLEKRGKGEEWLLNDVNISLKWANPVYANGLFLYSLTP